MTNHGNLDQIFMVSKAWYDNLSNVCQMELDAAIKEARKVVVDETLALEKRGLKAMIDQGTKVVELNDKQIQALRDTTLPPVRERFLEMTGTEGAKILEGIESEIGL